MPLGIPHPGGGVVLWIAAPHRPRFGALPSLLCSSLTRNKAKISKAFFFWVAEVLGGHTKVPEQLVGPVNLGLHAHNHEITGRLEPCAISTGEASTSGGAAGKQTPLRGNEASQL